MSQNALHISHLQSLCKLYHLGDVLLHFLPGCFPAIAKGGIRRLMSLPISRISFANMADSKILITGYGGHYTSIGYSYMRHEHSETDETSSVCKDKTNQHVHCFPNNTGEHRYNDAMLVSPGISVSDDWSPCSCCHSSSAWCYTIVWLHTGCQSTVLHVLSSPGTVLTRRLMLIPSTLDAPSTKALMAWVITCEMAILLETLLSVSTRDEMDLRIGTHLDRVSDRVGSRGGISELQHGQLWTTVLTCPLTVLCVSTTASSRSVVQMYQPCYCGCSQAELRRCGMGPSADKDLGTSR